MTQPNSNVAFEKMLLKFMNAKDPMLEMLSCLCNQLMEIEFTDNIGASKSERTESRTKYRAGYRPRRFDTRMGNMYLMVPKPHKGG